MIIAKRHIHMLPSDAEAYGVQNNQIVKIKCGGERGLIFDEVVVRVTDTSKLDTHIDTEE
jgi:propanediol utilization protein